MIKWTEQDKFFGLNHSTAIGIFKDFKFDIRYDSDGEPSVMPNCGVCMQIFFMESPLKRQVFAKNVESAKKYAEKMITDFLEKYPSV